MTEKVSNTFSRKRVPRRKRLAFLALVGPFRPQLPHPVFQTLRYGRLRGESKHNELAGGVNPMCR
jgi:hypothetical protein